MLLRERRQQLTIQIYQATFATAGLGINHDLFDAMTLGLIDELTHENYQPSVVKEKQRILDQFAVKRRVDKRLVNRVEQYHVRSAKDLTPYSKTEIEKIRDRLRKRELENATRKP